MASRSHNRRKLGASLCAATLLAAGASAHHPANTARVGDDPAALGAELSSAPPPPGSVLAGSSYNWSYFGRAIRGASADEGDGLGTAAIHTLSVQATWAIGHGMQAKLLLPWGRSTLSAVDSPSESSTGLGDIRLALSRHWRFSPVTDQRIELLFRAALSLPTGQYETDRGLQVRELSAGDQGQLTPTSYYSQVNLGLGAWAAIASAQAVYSPTPRLRLALRSLWSEPISTTGDDLHWGRDLSTSAAAGMPLGRRLTEDGGQTGAAWLPEVALSYLRHTSNTVGGPDGNLQGGASRQLEARAALAVSWASGTSCALAADLPLWQQASGLQLMKTVSSSFSCQWTVR